MNIFSRIYCRTFQSVLKVAMPFLGIKEPILQVEENIVSKTHEIFAQYQINNAFILTDKNLLKIGLLKSLIADLEKHNIKYSIFDNIKPNPTVQNVSEAYDAYLNSFSSNEQAILIAVGGGSVIDTMKVLRAKLLKPKKEIAKFAGLLKVGGKKGYPTIAIPTTSGSGSEATVAAVIIDEKTNHKFVINDPHLVPTYALLDPTLTTGLTPFLTATTGMDALTHLVEAYIGKANTKATKNYALTALTKINENLLKAYHNPKDLEARKEMALASYYAGCAFTRAYVGYVHAISHAFSALYDVPHGYGNAVILPTVLKEYGASVYKKLAKLAEHIMLVEKSSTSKSKKEDYKHKANVFIAYIEKLNEEMNIPTALDVEYNFNVVTKLAKHAAKEANPLYPVPKEFDATELVGLVSKSIKR